MDGAIFYATRYGSTAQYADWIAGATGLPAFNIDATEESPAEYDFVVLGAPVIYHKLSNAKWVRRNLGLLATKPVVFFSVSGAGAGAKLDGWIANSLPRALIRRMTHIALLGRQNPNDLTLFDRLMLVIAGTFNRDRKAAREEMHGFDFMDQSSILPVVDAIETLKSAGENAPQSRALH